MNKEPIIFITKPEKQLKEKDNLEIEINNYDNSHLYYKGFDLGTFKEIANLQQENKQLKENYERIYNENCILRKKHNINDISLLDENYRLENNWTNLKEYAKEIISTDNELYGTDLLNKMQEIEGSDSNE